MTSSMITMPSCPSAEQGLLGSLLHDNDQIWAVRSTIASGHFTDGRYAAVYNAILTCVDHGQIADLATVTDLLRGTPAFASLGVAGLLGLMEAEISGSRAVSYAQFVRDAGNRRELITAAQVAIEQAAQAGRPVGEALAEAEATLLRSASGLRHAGVRHVDQLVPTLLEAVAAARQHGAPPAGMPTGFVDLDGPLGGLQPGSLTVIAGRPSMGKSSLAISIAQNVAVRRGDPVLVFSLEVPAQQIVLNLTCAEARLPNNAARNGSLSADEYSRFRQAAESVRVSPLHVDDSPAITASHIRSAIRVACCRWNTALVIVDYIQLVRGDHQSAWSREREVAEISATLKAAARESNVPLIAVSQLNRAVENRKDKRPKLADLRESGAIEQDADAVLLLYRPGYYGTDDGSDGQEAQLRIAKNRNGPTATVKLVFFPAWTRFESSAPAHIEQPELAFDRA